MSSKPNNRSTARRGSSRSNGKPVTKKQVEAMIKGQQETKFLDIVNSITANYGGTVVALTDLGQGTTNITRIGNNITVRNLRFRYHLTCADSYNLVRVIIFRWHERFSLDPPDSSDILELVNSTNAVNAPYTFNERDAFTILFDKTETLVLSTSVNTAYVQGVLKVSQQPVQYFGSSTTDILNGLYFLVISDSSVTTHPGMNYYFRLEYTDS
jgi:hypothetical protein